MEAFIDTFGSGYVELALELGVRPDRINTMIDFAAVEEHGIKAEGNRAAASADVVAELAGMISKGNLEVPIARVYPLAEVRADRTVSVPADLRTCAGNRVGWCRRAT